MYINIFINILYIATLSTYLYLVGYNPVIIFINQTVYTVNIQG